ncbi:PTCD3-like protein [Mya arenaria]|uniref:PTCD3-like protein n=1 Tax=Mya arenaria TaxID=6604 RepID=A0ABY7FMK5_MYAAR|nr:PTCD3-like protein [Mya arenaria]
MAASMGLRSNFIKIKNNFLLQRSCVLCHKLYSTETSPSGTDVRKGRLHRIKKEIPYEELGAVIQEEERAKIVAYYSRNVRVERTDVSAAAGKEAIAKNSTILVQGDGKTPVSLPKKKKRDSLSILKALASTVKVEACLLAKASGKRAARYFVNKHVKLFGNDDAVPHIQPEKLDYVHTDVGEASLLERVDRREVADSVEFDNTRCWTLWEEMKIEEFPGGKKVDLVTDISEIVDQLSEQRKEDRVLNHFGENFFTKAMSFLHRFNEVTVAIKVFDLKESMGARYVITDLQMENAFYEQFMFLLLKNKPLDVVMEYYTKCIRHGKLSSPSNSLRYTLYDAIYQYDAYQWIPIIYSDMSSIGFRMTFFKQEFEKIADELHQVRKMREPMMTERMDDDIKTSHIIKIFLNNKNLQKAWEACLCEMEPNCRAMFKKHMNTLLTDREHELSAFLSKQRMDALRDIFLRD